MPTTDVAARYGHVPEFVEMVAADLLPGSVARRDGTALRH
jgi:hypothetical protein